MLETTEKTGKKKHDKNEREDWRTVGELLISPLSFTQLPSHTVYLFFLLHDRSLWFANFPFRKVPGAGYLNTNWDFINIRKRKRDRRYREEKEDERGKQQHLFSYFRRERSRRERVLFDDAQFNDDRLKFAFGDCQHRATESSAHMHADAIREDTLQQSARVRNWPDISTSPWLPSRAWAR